MSQDENFELNTSRLEEVNEASDAGKRVHPKGFIDGFQTQRKIRATYDFDELGGAIGDIGLGITLPKNALIKKGWIDVITDPTSAGAATLGLKLKTSEDVLANTAKASFTGFLDCIQDGAATNMIKLDADYELTLEVGIAALDAGKFHVFLEYDVSDPA